MTYWLVWTEYSDLEEALGEGDFEEQRVRYIRSLENEIRIFDRFDEDERADYLALHNEPVDAYQAECRRHIEMAKQLKADPREKPPMENL